MTKYVLVGIVCGLLWSCGKTKAIEETRGRLKHIKKLSYGRVGDGEGWYFDDHALFLNGQRWEPAKVDWNDIGNCEPSPNTQVEAFRCFSFADSKSVIYVYTLQGKKPVFEQVIDEPYIDSRGKNLGEWVAEGRWLLLRQKLVNAQILEQRLLKGLPAYPADYFWSISPDLRVVAYRDVFYDDYFKLPTYTALWDLDQQRLQKGIYACRLIDTVTGDARVVEFSQNDFPWLDRKRYNSIEAWKKVVQQRTHWRKEAGQWTVYF